MSNRDNRDDTARECATQRAGDDRLLRIEHGRPDYAELAAVLTAITARATGNCGSSEDVGDRSGRRSPSQWRLRYRVGSLPPHGTGSWRAVYSP